MDIDSDRDTNMDIDSDRDTNIDSDTEKLNKIVDVCRELRKMPGYPYSDDKDLPFVRDLLEEFSSIDFVSEIKQWQIWLLDNQERVKTKKVNHRSRLRRWCVNSAKWKANKGTYQKHGNQQGHQQGYPVKKPPQYEFEKDRPDKDQTKFEEVW